jgi:hypothetical protein
MKKIILLFICASVFLKINAQSINDTSVQSNFKHKNLYLGLGTGINNYTALLGISGSVKVYDKLFVRGGYGIGSWGNKFSIGLKYDMNYSDGWNFGIGYSICPGTGDVKMDLKVASGETKKVTADFSAASTINLTVGRNWAIGKRNIFYLDLGYAVPMQTEPWKVTDGSVLSKESKSVIKLIQPGGLIIGAGFIFGIF